MRVLAVGVATVDIINLVDRFPAEDEEIRAVGQRRVRGGNATNTLVVLSQLGHRCGWGGVIADEPDSRYILADLQAYRIDTSACVWRAGGKVPTSYILLNRASGSRTIVHYRDLPEYGSDDFLGVDLGAWDWLHFEGRNPLETAHMLARVKSRRPELKCSVEVEKPRDGIELLYQDPDALLFSRGYAQAKGFQDGGEFLRAIRSRTRAAKLFCGWGAGGGFAMDEYGQVYRGDAFPPPKIVDTLGAGDVFNAMIIDGLLRDYSIQQVLDHACRLAGRKCGIWGLAGIIDPKNRG